MATGDSVPYRYLPQAIVEQGTFRLDAFPSLDDPQYYAIVKDKGGHLVSKKPVTPALFEAPVFLAMRLFKGKLTELDRMFMGKITMSILAALASAGMFLVLLRIAPWWLAALGGIGVTCATPLWFTAMDCWPHPLLAMLNVYTMLLLFSPKRWGIAGAGLLQGIAFTTRPGAIVILALFLLFVFFCGGKTWKERFAATGMYIAGLAGPLILLGIYNAVLFGSPFSTGFGGQASSRIRWPWYGLAGLLFSPAKGLFVFSPVLVGMFMVTPSGWRQYPLAIVALLAFALHTVFWACYADWWGGWAWGPRYVTEALPFAIYLAAIGYLGLANRIGGKWIWPVAGILCVVSLFIQGVGAFSWNGDYHSEFDKGWGEGHTWVWKAPPEPVWRLRRGQFNPPPWWQD